MTAGEAHGGELTGKVLGGRYRVTSMIGRGGMGVVARAVDELLNREVAVKVLRAFTDTSAAELADLRTRMQREAQAAARIRHSGVVTVHDVTEEQGLPGHRHGTRRRALARRRADGARHTGAARSRRDRRQADGRARRRAPGRRTPPGRQAGKRADRARRQGRAHRFRHRQHGSLRRRRHGQADPERSTRRFPRLFAAGARAGQGARSRVGHLVARHDALRGRGGHFAVPPHVRVVHAVGDRHRAPAGAPPGGTAHAGAPGADGEGAGEPAHRGTGARHAGARRLGRDGAPRIRRSDADTRPAPAPAPTVGPGAAAAAAPAPGFGPPLFPQPAPQPEPPHAGYAQPDLPPSCRSTARRSRATPESPLPRRAGRQPVAHGAAATAPSSRQRPPSCSSPQAPASPTP